MENENTGLKHKYIQALRYNNEEKEQMLNNALELAVEIKNNKLNLKISNSLGEYYFKVYNYEKAITYYIDSCRQVKNIVISVPEEFRISYINFNNLYKYYNILVRIKQDYYKVEGDTYKKYDHINNEAELIEFFDELDKILS